MNRRAYLPSTALPTFRPRRRPKRLAAQSEKYHHSLRALRFAKKDTFVGKTTATNSRYAYFLDVESLPDRDFYYLVGIRIEVDGRPTHYSFWADSLSDERTI